MSQSISDFIKEHVGNAIDAHAGGDQFYWDVGAGATPEGVLVHFIAIIAPSPILGQTLQTRGMITDAQTVTGEQIASMVQDAFEHIRQERTRLLTEQAPAPA